MRILITGGAGCLGSNLIEHWLPAGHEICVLDNFATGKREVVPDVARLTVREGSVSDKAFVDAEFTAFQPEIVVHAAASYNDPEHWAEDASTNVLGSILVARAAEMVRAKRLINFQTALCFGRPDVLPIPADHRVAPFTSYGISKTAGEAFMQMSSVPTLSLRIANVTGPRLAIGPIPTFYQRLKDGKSCFCSDTSRDFLDISDFVAFMDLAIAENAPSGTYNISTGEAHSIKDVFDSVCAFLGQNKVDVPIIPPGEDDVPAVYLDASQTEKDFGWKAVVGFDDMIARQLKWYDTYGISDVFSHLKPQA